MTSNTQTISVSETERATSRIAFSWLLYLRWGALACQIILILAVYLFFDTKLPFFILFAIIAFAAASNIFFHVWTRKKLIIPGWLTALVMFLDVSLLTLLLSQTGGPMNPFTFLYLIHIALGAILTPTRWSWSLTFFTIFCYASFFYFPDIMVFLDSSLGVTHEIQELCHYSFPSSVPMQSDELTMHLQGMWVAFSITAFFIVFFVGKIQKALDKHQETLAILKDERLKTEKLAALATFSAGAAHEFSTPLSTIAVASGEMIRALKKNGASQELTEDAQLIREQVNRCKDILYQLAADAGEPLGELSEERNIKDFLAEIEHTFPSGYRDRIETTNEVGDLFVRFPHRTIKRAIKGIVKNGFDATQDDSPIFLRCKTKHGFLVIEVEDKGAGMDQDTLARATEPFFTTKDPGKGLGLGLFLAKSIAERFGGGVTIHSVPAQGTIVGVRFSLSHITAE